jgi:hypothetical protein
VNFQLLPVSVRTRIKSRCGKIRYLEIVRGHVVSPENPLTLELVVDILANALYSNIAVAWARLRTGVKMQCSECLLCDVAERGKNDQWDPTNQHDKRSTKPCSSVSRFDQADPPF